MMTLIDCHYLCVIKLVALFRRECDDKEEATTEDDSTPLEESVLVGRKHFQILCMFVFLRLPYPKKIATLDD